MDAKDMEILKSLAQKVTKEDLDALEKFFSENNTVEAFLALKDENETKSTSANEEAFFVDDKWAKWGRNNLLANAIEEGIELAMHEVHDMLKHTYCRVVGNQLEFSVTVYKNGDYIIEDQNQKWNVKPEWGIDGSSLIINGESVDYDDIPEAIKNYLLDKCGVKANEEINKEEVADESVMVDEYGKPVLDKIINFINCFK